MIGYYDVIYKLKSLLDEDVFCNTVTTGTVNEVLLSKQDIYPYSHIIVNSKTDEGSTNRWSVSVICMDIVDETKEETMDIFRGNDNTIDILNTQFLVISRMLAKLRRDEYTSQFQLDGSPNDEPFTDRFEHGVAGWTSTFDILTPNDMTICDE